MVAATRAERMLDDLDPLDIAILRLLQEQGRRPNAQIARELGVSEPTVRKRIDRMVEDEIIKVVAVLNPRKTGYATDVLIGVRVTPGKLIDVGTELSKLDEVVYLGYTTGRYDILVEMLFRDDEDLFGFLSERAPQLEGLFSTETYHVLRTEKINYDWKLPSTFIAAVPRGGEVAERSSIGPTGGADSPEAPAEGEGRRRRAGAGGRLQGGKRRTR